MSTRSGKRIHNSFSETTVKVDTDASLASERKTRKKRFKENEETLDITAPLPPYHPKTRNRSNYVSYPSEEEPAKDTNAVTNDVAETKTTRTIKRYTLKERTTNIPQYDSSTNSEAETGMATRVTRQTKKFNKNSEDEPPQLENLHSSEVSVPVVKKKNKKKKSLIDYDISNNHTETVERLEENTKNSKKKVRKSKTYKELELIKNTITDSDDTCADSPMSSKRKSPHRKSLHNGIFENEQNSNIMSSRAAQCTIDNVIIEDSNLTKVCSTGNDSFSTDQKKRRKSSIKVMGNDEASISTTKPLNSTFDKVETEANVQQLNTTFEENPEARRSLRSSNIAVQNNHNTTKSLNNTLEKTRKKEVLPINLDSTLNKSDEQLNSTYDKNKPKVDSGKSSLLTSDEGEINVTYDKDENLRISITSDESKTENIVNATPLLIESSMDDSNLSTLSKSDSNLTKEKDSSPTQVPNKNSLQVPITPLKREGTFTKESQEVRDTVCTPIKQDTFISSSTPGRTPFVMSRSSERSKSVMNVTRSLEKSHRFSIVEAVPRQTRVMFCSPINSPGVATERKRLVIKSSLKGSNKSFVLDEKEHPVRPTARKRSYTQNDADDRSSKRKRLAESADRLSRPRTSSATATRTCTPYKKKPVTPARKSEIKRTRLPNFAALHQKEFAKMESLDECVDRKARRAQGLLTPTKAKVLESDSPKVTEEPTKEATKARIPKETAETPEKPGTPVKSTKIPTSACLRPGYTRFGFKLNNDIKPFSFSGKKKTKPSEKQSQKPEETNGFNASFAPKTPVLPAEKPTLPALTGATFSFAGKKNTKPKEKQSQKPEEIDGLNATFAAKTPVLQADRPILTGGATTSRKEMAKKTVLREKSFTSLKRNAERNEYRTIIKGVRTNRRFDLQMKMRNID